MSAEIRRLLSRDEIEQVQVKAQNAALDWTLASDEPCDLIMDLLNVCDSFLALPALPPPREGPRVACQGTFNGDIGCERRDGHLGACGWKTLDDDVDSLGSIVARPALPPVSNSSIHTDEKSESNRLPALPPDEAPEDDEPPHTGDDARVDAVTSIRAGVDALRDEADEDQREDTIAALVDDCDQLDALILATIARERATQRALAALPPDDPPCADWHPQQSATLAPCRHWASYTDDGKRLGCLQCELVVAVRALPAGPVAPRLPDEDRSFGTHTQEAIEILKEKP